MREVGASAFEHCYQLKSAELNEGLEKLGTREATNAQKYDGHVFTYSAIESIKLPSTLKRLEAETFYSCENIRSVEIPNGVEYIGEECFSYSGIEETTLPGTLKKICEDAF